MESPTKKETPTQVFSCEVFKNTYFEEHLRMTASEFIGDNFQDDKEYNQKQHFEW